MRERIHEFPDLAAALVEYELAHRKGSIEAIGPDIHVSRVGQGGSPGIVPTPPAFEQSFWSAVGLLPFKTIVLSFKSRLAFYRVFFGSGSSSCGVSGKEGTEGGGFIIIKTSPHSVFIISPVGTCFSSPRQHVYCDRWSWRFGWVGQFFVRFVIRLVSKLELFIFRPASFFSLTTRFLAGVIGLRPALGESHQSFAAFYRGQLSRLNPGPNRAFRIPQITHFSNPFPALFRSHNGCARTIFFASPKQDYSVVSDFFLPRRCEV